MYVGITSQKPTERWKNNGDGYKRCPIFYRAIQKYGWENFEHQVFASNLTKEEAENMEMTLIEKLETQNRNFGYNILEGGSSPVLTEEIKQKISKSKLGKLNPMYGRKHTEEEKENLRNKMLGENNPRYGIHLSEEIRNKISKSLTGRKASEEARRNQSQAQIGLLKGRKRPEGGGRPAKKIRCVETGKTFDSVAEAARYYNIGGKSNISRCAKGIQKTSGGFHWEYV